MFDDDDVPRLCWRLQLRRPSPALTATPSGSQALGVLQEGLGFGRRTSRPVPVLRLHLFLLLFLQLLLLRGLDLLFDLLLLALIFLALLLLTGGIAPELLLA